MKRADHFLEAQRLQGVAVEIAQVEREHLDRALAPAGRVDHTRLEIARLYADLALVSATLASAGPGVEAEIVERERKAAQIEAMQQVARANRPRLVRPDVATAVASAFDELEQQQALKASRNPTPGLGQPGPH